MHNVINTSLVIQTKLFLRAEPATHPWVFESHDVLLAGEKAAAQVRITAGTTESLYTPQPAYAPHPLLIKQPGDETRMGLVSRLSFFVKYSYSPKLDIVPAIRYCLRNISADASCRAMYITQPPITKISFDIHGRCEYLPWEERRGLQKWFVGTVKTAVVTNESGVTFGQLVDEIEKHMGYEKASFHHLEFSEAFLVTSEEKEFMEMAQKVTMMTDPFSEDVDQDSNW